MTPQQLSSKQELVFFRAQLDRARELLEPLDDDADVVERALGRDHWLRATREDC